MARMWGVAIRGHRANLVQASWRRRVVWLNCPVKRLDWDGVNGRIADTKEPWHVFCFPLVGELPARLVAREGTVGICDQQDRSSYLTRQLTSDRSPSRAPSARVQVNNAVVIHTVQGHTVQQMKKSTCFFSDTKTRQIGPWLY